MPPPMRRPGLGPRKVRGLREVAKLLRAGKMNANVRDLCHQEAVNMADLGAGQQYIEELVAWSERREEERNGGDA